MYPGCEKCTELWRQYGFATMIHVQLDNKLRFAALQNDLDLIESLTRETEGAEKVRVGLRESIREHEALHRTATQTAHDRPADNISPDVVRQLGQRESSPTKRPLRQG